jgi:hypothetical protein
VVDESPETVTDRTEIDEITRQDPGSGLGGHSAVFRLDQPAGRPRHDMSPPEDPEPRTLVETEWVPGQGQTPPPWQLPSQYQQWQQPAPPTLGQGARDRERRRTIAIVTIAVILVVAGVLAGALILRMSLNGG